MNFEHSAQIENDEWEFPNLVTCNEVACNTKATSKLQPRYKRGPYKKARAKHTSLRSATDVCESISAPRSPSGVESAPSSLLFSDDVADAPSIKRSGDVVSKSWCFTWNNYTEEDIVYLKSWEHDVSKMIVAKEVGESGTPHLQCAVTWNSAKRWSGVKKLIPQCHFEKIRNPMGAFLYCDKGGEVVISINMDKKRGQRTDWDDLKEMIKMKKPRCEIAEAHPHLYATCHKGIEALASALFDKRPFNYMMEEKPKEVIWVWGAPGVGKSRWVRNNYPREDTWRSGRKLQWFNGYIGQKIAWIDEFRASKCDFSYLLELTDAYQIEVETKGGMVDWTPETIVFTSCKPPDKIYHPDTFDNEEKLEQLLRRITKIIHLTVSEVQPGIELE